MAPPRDPPPTDAAAPTIVLDGPALARAFRGAADALAAQADALNAINVFPVPDGDTGINMSMTMRAAVDAISSADARSPSATAKAVAEGALMGARGNSGVILSQILAGFAAATPAAHTATSGPVPQNGTGSADGALLADGLELGRDAAYRVVSNPKEGTILTAIASAAHAAREAAAAGAGAEAALAAAVDGARDAVARTPDLLPVLREAGVVDAGAQGLYVALDGMLRALRGEAIAAAQDFGAIDQAWLAETRRVHDEGERAGFCTQFVVRRRDAALDPEALRTDMSRLGDSVLVVGDGDVARVHVHTDAPDDAIAQARANGDISHEVVTDMEAQFRDLAAGADSARPGQAPAPIAVIAVAAGRGLESLFRSLEATVVRGGQTMNPSAGEIRAAIEAVHAETVIVLPNNKNIVLAAEQAAASFADDAAGTDVRVVPSRSIPQGVAALVALNMEASVDENLAAMNQAIASVRTADITHAARPTRIDGAAVREGQPIGLVDGELAVAAETVDDAVRSCIARMAGDRTEAVITLYAGDGTQRGDAESLAASIREQFGAEVELVEGGQPHYPYLIGVE